MRAKRVKGISKGHLYCINPDLIVVPANSSPLSETLNYVFRAIFNIVPEMKNEIAEIIGSKHIKLQLVDDGNVTMMANVDKRRVRFGIRTLELFWGISCRIGISLNGAIEEHNNTDEEAKGLLSWIKKNFKKSNYIIPSEMIPTMTSSTRQLVDEIFLAAIAWMLHHELIHIEKDHPAPEFELDGEYIRIEKEADKLAAERIIEPTTTGSKMREKRMLGILVAVFGISYMDRNITNGYIQKSKFRGFRERLLDIKCFRELPDEQFLPLMKLLDLFVLEDPFYDPN